MRNSSGVDAVAPQHAPVHVGFLLGDDLDHVEPFRETRPRDLALLVEEVALGDEQQPVAAGERVDDVSATPGSSSTGCDS